MSMLESRRSHMATIDEPQPELPESGSNPKGIRIEPTFCPVDITDPFDTVQWELRSAAIKDENGGVLFEQSP